MATCDRDPFTSPFHKALFCGRRQLRATQSGAAEGRVLGTWYVTKTGQALLMPVYVVRDKVFTRRWQT